MIEASPIHDALPKKAEKRHIKPLQAISMPLRHAVVGTQTITPSQQCGRKTFY